MHRLSLDANVLFSAAYREGAGVARLWELSEAALLTSNYTIEEARRNLSEDAQRTRLERLLKKIETTSATTLEKSLRSKIELREKDWPVLGGAVAAQASHLITGDLRDFGRYFGQTLLGVLVQPPADYFRSRS